MLIKGKSVVGLDVGSSSVKAIELTQFGNELVVTAYGRNEVLSEGSRADAIIDMLRRIKPDRAPGGTSMLLQLQRLPQSGARGSTGSRPG